MNLGAERGSAVRASPLKTGFADCLLFVGLSATPPAWHSPLPFLYESTVVERFFTNGLDPQPPHDCVPSTRDAGQLGQRSASGAGAVAVDAAIDRTGRGDHAMSLANLRHEYAEVVNTANILKWLALTND